MPWLVSTARAIHRRKAVERKPAQGGPSAQSRAIGYSEEEGEREVPCPVRRFALRLRVLHCGRHERDGAQSRVALIADEPQQAPSFFRCDKTTQNPTRRVQCGAAQPSVVCVLPREVDWQTEEWTHSRFETRAFRPRFGAGESLRVERARRSTTFHSPRSSSPVSG